MKIQIRVPAPAEGAQNTLNSQGDQEEGSNAFNKYVQPHPTGPMISYIDEATGTRVEDDTQ
jgi:hypothetical protein